MTRSATLGRCSPARRACRARSPLKEETKCLGISATNWARITVGLLFLYVCLGLLYWGLLEAAMDIRGSNYLVLPKRFYGDFIRNTYPAYPKHEFEAASMVSEEWSFPPWSASAAVRALVDATKPATR